MFSESRIITYRSLMMLSFGLALLSLIATLSHIKNVDYLVSDAVRGETHGWYHLFRESIGNIGSMVAVTILMFCHKQSRRPLIWWIMAILVFSNFAPYWIGYPWHGVSAPSLDVEVGHILQAVFASLSLIIAKPDYAPPETQPT